MAKELAGIACIALGVDAVLVVAPVAARGEQVDAFPDARARMGQPLLIRPVGGVSRGAVSDAAASALSK